MKTIKFKGTEDQLTNLKNAMDFSDNEMPKEVETRVYVVDTHKVLNKSHSELSDEEFIMLAKEGNEDLSLSAFQKHFNIGEYDSPHYVIRFINTEV
jgi:hypothetical protein